MKVLCLFLCLKVFTPICQTVKLSDDYERKLSPTVDRTMPDMAVVMSQCNETYNIEVSYLDSLNTSGSFPDETHETPKCYMECLLAKVDVTTAAGGFDAARAAAVFGRRRGGRLVDDVEHMATVCADKVKEEASGCERAYEFLKCLMQMQVEKYETNDQSENQGKVDYSKKR